MEAVSAEVATVANLQGYNCSGSYRYKGLGDN